MAAFGVSPKLLSVTGPAADSGAHQYLYTILRALRSFTKPLLELAGVNHADYILLCPHPLGYDDGTRVSEGRENRLLEMKGESRKQ